MDAMIIIEQDGIDAFEKQVNKLLEILDHPEALVTDLSDFGDFIMCYHENPFRVGTKEERQQELDALLIPAGITTKIDVFDTFVVAIRKILADNPNWPDPPTVN